MMENRRPDNERVDGMDEALLAAIAMADGPINLSDCEIAFVTPLTLVGGAPVRCRVRMVLDGRGGHFELDDDDRLVEYEVRGLGIELRRAISPTAWAQYESMPMVCQAEELVETYRTFLALMDRICREVKEFMEAKT